MTLHYRQDFGADLELPDPLLPIATFIVERGTRASDGGRSHSRIPGVRFVAGIHNPGDVSVNPEAGKHEEFRFVSEEEVALLDDAECVPDFKRVHALALKAWREWKGLKASDTGVQPPAHAAESSDLIGLVGTTE